MQAWGELETKRCKRCTIDEEDDEMSGGYLEYRTIDPLFNGCCGNCKRDEKGRECEHNVALKEVKKEAAKQYAKQHRDNSYDKSPRHGGTTFGDRGWESERGSNNYLP